LFVWILDDFLLNGCSILIGSLIYVFVLLVMLIYGFLGEVGLVGWMILFGEGNVLEWRMEYCGCLRSGVGVYYDY